MLVVGLIIVMMVCICVKEKIYGSLIERCKTKRFSGERGGRVKEACVDRAKEEGLESCYGS